MHIKTFKGIMVVRWHKNDGGGDRRPLAIDCRNVHELRVELKRIRRLFYELGEDASYPLAQPQNLGKKPFFIKFEF